jgi:DNA-binding MarR family transcriptional regulator
MSTPERQAPRRGATAAGTTDPAPPESDFDIHAYVPTLIVNLANQLWRVGAAFYRQAYGIGMVELRLVLYLGRHVGKASSEIARATELDKAAVSRGLAALERDGLVRMVKDQRGGGRKRVLLSEKGQQLHGQLAVVSLERQAWILGELTPEEIRNLSDLLRRLNARVSHLNDGWKDGAAMPPPAKGSVD